MSRNLFKACGLATTIFAGVGCANIPIDTGKIDFEISVDEDGGTEASVTGGFDLGKLGAGPVAKSDRAANLHPANVRATAKPSFYEADNITYDLGEGTIRTQPVDPKIMRPLSEIARQHDPGLEVVVVSGGQHPLGSGKPRTGSTRHDIDHAGYGQAVDFYLRLHGRRLYPASNVELYASFIESAARYFTGIGHYSWGLHAGFGSLAFWGSDTTAKSALPRFRDAFWKGRQGA